ncbi:MAG TPA: hypothetical protein VLE96_05800 [Chlamydiales bacterium]|nr:hypothetical protein [Chlamydiales bacterium]
MKSDYLKDFNNLKKWCSKGILRKIVIWAVALFLLWLTYPSNKYEHKFIIENELVTQDMLEWTICSWLFIFAIKKMTGNYLFHDEEQENWAKDIQTKIEAIESRLSSESMTKECRDQLITELERNFREFDQRIQQNYQSLKGDYKRLEKRVYDHLQDCPHIFQCGRCDYEADVFNFIANDDGDLMCPICHSSAAVTEKKISRHLQTSTKNS